MSETRKIKLAVIGLGVMGSAHCHDIVTMENAELAAVCDVNRELADQFAQQYNVPAYYDYKDVLEKAGVDGIIIATPHYFHTPIMIDGMACGMNVLSEKPIGVTTKDAKKMIAAYEAAKATKPEIVFAIMFQQRTHGFWRKIKEMIDGGELGRLTRATWIITDWFRTQAYYDNGGWRATWSGEGGGVLLNQCPHNLDLFQWFVGTPKRVTGFAHIGKYHNIEVEDEVTGYFEYENGMIGHFLTTTAESPGTNRLEIVGENGKLVFEAGKLMFTRNSESMLEFIQSCPRSFDKVQNETIEVAYPQTDNAAHKLVTTNFCNAILNGEELIAPGPEGLRGLSISNAIMLSSFLGQTVEMPLDDDEYASRLAELAKNSRFQKVTKKAEESDFSMSFSGASK